MKMLQKQKKIFVYDDAGFDALKTFSALAQTPYSQFLDSDDLGHPLNNFSYILYNPFETIESKDGVVTITNADNQFSYAADAFQVVRERLNLWASMMAKPKKNLSPFQGGAVGYFGYDLVRGLEKIPSNATPHKQPDMCIGLYDKVLAFDHKKNKAYFIVQADNQDIADIEKKNLENIVLSHKSKTPSDSHIEWNIKKTDEEFKNDISRVVEYIHAGDIFQANLSRKFTAIIPNNFDSFDHYQYLRTINPAPYSAYMNFGDIKLASSSPERFLSVKDKTIETRPIKGTIPSFMPPSSLEESQKNRAENIMIVDLLRNDLSKVCEDHSIIVDNLCAIETFAGLHHMVSTVRGLLRADKTAIDALRACFPGGSITGAPKIRAMEIIDELEPHRRGAYCGAMGYIGFDGVMDTAIMIRTLVYANGEVHIQTGGGITAQSIPSEELEETLIKAQKLFESFCTAELTEIKKTA